MTNSIVSILVIAAGVAMVLYCVVSIIRDSVQQYRMRQKETQETRDEIRGVYCTTTENFQQCILPDGRVDNERLMKVSRLLQ